MIQVNLLPGIKAEYVKAQRTRRTVTVVSFIIIASSLAVVAVLSSVAFGVQRIQLNGLDASIEEHSKKLKGINDLDKVLTVQNQLNSLDSIHASKPVMSRLFGYMQQTTPADVTIDSFTINTTDSTWVIEGAAPTMEIVNRYVDTLKFTEIVSSDPNAQVERPFSSVVLAQFAKSEDRYTFNINFKFDPRLYSFDSAGIAIKVPQSVTTRSTTEAPKIFAPNPEIEKEEEE